MLESHHNLRSVEGNSNFVKVVTSLLFLKLNISKKFAAAHKLHDQVELVFGLECKLHINDEGRIYLGKDRTLSHGVLKLTLLEDFVFLQHFHGVGFLVSFTTFGRFFVYQKHFAESALAQKFMNFKIFKTDVFVVVIALKEVGR